MKHTQKKLEPGIRKIFKIPESKENVICPPDQVFINADFKFSLTIGGHLAADEEEYAKLMKLLTELGETKFYLTENLGATMTKRINAFKAIIPVTSNFEFFDKKVRELEPPFGFTENHFFVFGENPNWGIYICEYPTINIIGCIPELEEKFREIFNVKDNGYVELESFIKQEFQDKKVLINKLITNYKLR